MATAGSQRPVGDLPEPDPRRATAPDRPYLGSPLEVAPQIPRGATSGPRKPGTDPVAPARPSRRRRSRLRGHEGLAGWVFTTPMIIILGLFLFLPILMALWVSLTDWQGNGSPFVAGGAHYIGAKNYLDLFARDGLTRTTFMQSIGNTFYYVLLVVPLQTALALGLALLVNSKVLRAKGLFRTAFYFPSVTSSVAISTVFLFLFSNSGTVNALLGLFGISGPQWFTDDRGLLHLLLGVFGVHDPGWAQTDVLGRSVWDWLSGPSVAMCVIIILVVWTTSGTFMLMFLAALQDVPNEIEEAAALDGASAWQKLRRVTIPMIRPVLFLVITLGLIGTWQVFDQVYIMGKGAPAGTTLTPAYLSYRQSFGDFKYGSGAAMAFVVFVIIVVFTWIQRRMLTEKDQRKPLLRRRSRP